VNDPANQSVCIGDVVNATFSSPSGNPTYTWTNNNTAIGLGVSGSGNISFTAANVTTPTTGTITVTPTENNCPRNASNIYHHRKPSPLPSTSPPTFPAAPANPATVNFSGSSGATFAWTNSNTAIGLGASGSGNINFTIANVTTQEVGTITVTPTSPAGCPRHPGDIHHHRQPGADRE
jgi:hypothetical protein